MKTFALISCIGAASVVCGDAVAADKLYHAYNVAASITYASLEPAPNGAAGSVVTYRKLANKQFINLARGRDLDAVVPKNEILVALLPDDYRDTTAGRVVVMDTTNASILSLVVTTNTATLGYGAPNGYGSQGVGTGTIFAMGNAGFSIAQTTLSMSIKCVEKPTVSGPIQNGKVISMSGPLPLTVGGNAKPAIVTSGSVRIFGKVMLDLYADL
ncbi:MAG: hypothetical protein RL088_945 [Verrucomicrobiota bacterium]|jgi:hypothetical protein